LTGSASARDHFPAPLEQGFKDFEQRRKPRTTSIAATARDNDDRSLQQLGPMAYWLRDHTFLGTAMSRSRSSGDNVSGRGGDSARSVGAGGPVLRA
jgi:hypothetical protein